MNQSKKKLIARVGWLWLLVILGGNLCVWSFKFGVKEGREEIIKEISKPDLRIFPQSSDGIQLVVIRQIMPPGDLKKNRVEVNADAIDGLTAKRLGVLGRGEFGYFEEITIWNISNTKDRVIQLIEAAFTNLPEGYTLEVNFDDDFSIQPTSGANPSDSVE